jgi:hypothetical protein
MHTTIELKISSNNYWYLQLWIIALINSSTELMRFKSVKVLIKSISSNLIGAPYKSRYYNKNDKIRIQEWWQGVGVTDAGQSIELYYDNLCVTHPPYPDYTFGTKFAGYMNVYFLWGSVSHPWMTYMKISKYRFLHL